MGQRSRLTGRSSRWVKAQQCSQWYSHGMHLETNRQHQMGQQQHGHISVGTSYHSGRSMLVFLG
jgi:hypothetical protein